MPPKNRFTREEIIENAFEIVKEQGKNALTVRSLADKLGCSVKPIFGLFKNMDEVHSAVFKHANIVYRDYILEKIQNSKTLPYKASGMAYIGFAKEYKEIFKMLFMRQRSDEENKIGEDFGEVDTVIKMVMEKTGLSEEKARLMHFELWLFVHGIATMAATDYLDLSEEAISSALTDAFMGFRHRFCGDDK